MHPEKIEQIQQRKECQIAKCNVSRKFLSLTKYQMNNCAIIYFNITVPDN